MNPQLIVGAIAAITIATALLVGWLNQRSERP